MQASGTRVGKSPSSTSTARECRIKLLSISFNEHRTAFNECVQMWSSLKHGERKTRLNSVAQGIKQVEASIQAAQRDFPVPKELTAKLSSLNTRVATSLSKLMQNKTNKRSNSEIGNACL